MYRKKRLNRLNITIQKIVESYQRMNKMLLMGMPESGKSSMLMAIFNPFYKHMISKLASTKGYIVHSYKFLGSVRVNFWDCGGNNIFMEKFFQDKESTFQGVQVLTYVFDVTENKQNMEKSLQYFQKAVKNVKEFNQNARIFVLINKTDKLLGDAEKQVEISQKKEVILASVSSSIETINILSTNIFDGSLFEAWSSIIQTFIPKSVQRKLQILARASECKIVAILHCSTCLVLSCYEEKKQISLTKFEKVSRMVQGLQNLAINQDKSINKFEIVAKQYTSLISEFTKTENMLAIFPNQSSKEAVKINIKNLGKKFMIHKERFM